MFEVLCLCLYGNTLGVNMSIALTLRKSSRNFCNSILLPGRLETVFQVKSLSLKFKSCTISKSRDKKIYLIKILEFPVLEIVTIKISSINNFPKFQQYHFHTLLTLISNICICSDQVALDEPKYLIQFSTHKANT